MVTEKDVSKLERSLRAKHVGNSSPFEYCMGMNLVFLTGKVTRPPVMEGSKKTKRTWFKMFVPDQDNPDRMLFVVVHCKNELGLVMFENLQAGDVVAVVGRLFTAKRPVKDLIYVAAERISSPFPFMVDADPQFVRLRWDFYNRIVAIVGEKDLSALPPRKRRELAAEFAKQAGEGDDP